MSRKISQMTRSEFLAELKQAGEELGIPALPADHPVYQNSSFTMLSPSRSTNSPKPTSTQETSPKKS